MTKTFFTGTLEPIECGVIGCGIYFGLSPALHHKMLAEGARVFCPNGHQIWYSETEVDRLKRRLAQETHAAEQARADRDFQRRRAERQERRARALKGHHTKLKRRVAHGVCPCCRRSFVNVKRHMETKHAAYVQRVKA